MSQKYLEQERLARLIPSTDQERDSKWPHLNRRGCDTKWTQLFKSGCEFQPEITLMTKLTPPDWVYSCITSATR